MPNTPMIADIDAHLAAIGWSARELAVRLKAHPNTINDWRLGRRKTPEPVLLWLERLSSHHETDPPPDWRTRLS